MITLFLAISFLMWILVYRYKRRRLYELASHIPGPKGMPFIGIAYKGLASSKNATNTINKYSYESMKHNGLISAWVGPFLYFIMTDPADLEFVLKNCLEKDDTLRFLRDLTGNGGIFAPVSIWRRRRKILIPAFSPKIVENFVDVFSEQSQILMTVLKSQENKGKFSIWPYITSYALDSVCESAMGMKINSQGNLDNNFLNSAGKAFNILCARMSQIWLHPYWIFKMSPHYKKLKKNVHVVHSFLDQLIKKKRADIAKQKQNQTKEENQEQGTKIGIESYGHQSFLDVLIKFSGGENGYTNVELREEMLTIALAGSDTSVVAIGYTLLLLAKYPEVQDKVYQELLDVYGKSMRPLVKEDLQKLQYLEHVIKESLRLFPPAPLIIRKVLEEIVLPSGRVLPAGSSVLCSIWGAHRDPKYWGPDVEKFDPDRFMPERFYLKYACSYMPFSFGGRNCIGYKYAIMSMKTVLSTLMRNYRIVPDPETCSTPQVRVKIAVTMKDIDGYQVALERRTLDNSSTN